MTGPSSTFTPLVLNSPPIPDPRWRASTLFQLAPTWMPLGHVLTKSVPRSPLPASPRHMPGNPRRGTAGMNPGQLVLELAPAVKLTYATVSLAIATIPLSKLTYLFLKRHSPHQLPCLPSRISPLPSTRDIRYHHLSAPSHPLVYTTPEAIKTPQEKLTRRINRRRLAIKPRIIRDHALVITRPRRRLAASPVTITQRSQPR